MARSETVDNLTGGSEVNVARTSRGMFFERGETGLIDRIEQRIAAMLRWPVQNGEGLQVLHYQPGAEYKPHYDYFDPVHPGSAAILKRGGQRVGTLLMYLNTPRQGRRHHLPGRRPRGRRRSRATPCFFSYDRAARQHQEPARRRAGDRGREVGRHQVAARARVQVADRLLKGSTGNTRPRPGSVFWAQALGARRTAH